MKVYSGIACVLLLASCTGGAEGPAGTGVGGGGGGAGQDAGGPGGSSSLKDGGAAGATTLPVGIAGTSGAKADAGVADATGAAGTMMSPSGTGGGGGSAATIDAGRPATDAGLTTTAGLHIVFPPSGAVTSDQIVVRGTNTLGGTIHVNGAAATSSDGFATFRATVPLATGDNTISVTAESSTGASLGKTDVVVRRFASDDSIQRGGGDAFSIFRTFGFAIDADQREAIICDDIYDGLVRIDLRTGDRSLASASESSNKGMVGKGYNEIDNPRGVTLDKPGHALVVDGGKMIGIDLASGDRTLLSGAGAGSGTTAKLFVAVGYDPTGHRAVALDYEGNALLAIDPVSGARSVLSGASKGSGPGFDSYGPSDLDLAHNRALTTRAYANPVIAIDLATGNRSILSGDNAGSGPTIAEPYAPAVAPALGAVFVWDRTAKRIMAVDLTTGARRVVADGATGMGVDITGVDRMSFGRDLLFVRANGGLLAVDPLEGHRVVISR